LNDRRDDYQPMNSDTIKKLSAHGYRVYQSKDYFIVRKKVYTSLAVLLIFMVPGSIFLLAGLLSVPGINDLGLTLLLISLGIVLMIAPFFNYLTSAYRSMIADFNTQSLLFRSGYSRAYRFSEVTDVKLEVVQRNSDTNAFSNSNKEYEYTITAHFGNQDKEEIFALTFGESESEKFMFDLKDYFEAIIKIRKFQ